MFKVNDVVTINTGDLKGEKCKITKVSTSESGETVYCGTLTSRAIKVCELRESDFKERCCGRPTSDIQKRSGDSCPCCDPTPVKEVPTVCTGDPNVDKIINEHLAQNEAPLIGRPLRSLF